MNADQLKFEATIWGVDNSVMYFEKISQIELIRIKRRNMCEEAISNGWRKFEDQDMKIPPPPRTYPPPNLSMTNEIFRHKIQQLDKAMMIQQMEEKREESVRRSQHDQRRRYHNHGRIGSGRFLRRKPF